MKIRIILVAVILGSLTICGLNGLKLSQRVAHLRLEAQTEKDARSQAEAELARIKIELRKMDQAREQAARTAESAKAEMEAALAEVDVQAKRSEKLAQELASTRRDLAESRDQMARGSTESPTNAMERVKQLEAALVRAQKKNQILSRQAQAMSEKLPMEPCVWYLPEDFQGKVVAVDPKWRFFVLDAGEDQGALERGELLVNRNGRLIAKVMIRRVQKDHSIGSVVPGWGLGEIKEGDSFIAVAD